MKILVTAFQPFNNQDNNYSLEVLNYIKDYLNKTCYTSIGKICNHCNTYRIYICKNRDIVLDHLYYDNCVCLDRKYNFIKNNYR